MLITLWRRDLLMAVSYVRQLEFSGSVDCWLWFSGFPPLKDLPAVMTTLLVLSM